MNHEDTMTTTEPATCFTTDARAAAATRPTRRPAAAGTQGGRCCGAAVSTTDEHGHEVFGATLYADTDAPAPTDEMLQLAQANADKDGATNEFQTVLTKAGLVHATIDETHRVHAHAATAIIRARKPWPTTSLR